LELRLNLVNEIADYDHMHDYALQDEGTEKVHLADHAHSLDKARHRQKIWTSFPSLTQLPLPANPMLQHLAMLFRKIGYTYKLRE
jgi:hypothetical protein